MWFCTKLRSAEDVIDFSKIASSKEGFVGTTVILENDIDFAGGFAEKFVPIGYNRGTKRSYDGVFDGKGYVIKNLVMKAADISTIGLFGDLIGSVKNVVMDASCSFESQFSSTVETAYVGSITGYFVSNDDHTNIENCVNMAALIFSGKSTAKEVYIGGIAGEALASNMAFFIMKNCVNYGAITFAGTVPKAYAGGIFGRASCIIEYTGYIVNCANYGTVELTGSSTSMSMYMGGISGFIGEDIQLENVLSAGKIASAGSAYIGTFVGKAYGSYNVILNSFWTSDVGTKKSYGDGGAVLRNNNEVSLNATEQETLNKAAEKNGWDKWIMLNLNGGKINGLPQSSIIATDKQFHEPYKGGCHL